jgi:outer membrane protein OmpA-like peptidoglycan-associated protein
MSRRLGVVLLAGLTLLAGTVTAVAIAAGSGRVLELRLRTANLILRVNGYGEQQSSSPSQVGITLAADVLFRFNSAELSAGAQSVLGGVAAEVHHQARGPVKRDGYTH